MKKFFQYLIIVIIFSVSIAILRNKIELPDRFGEVQNKIQEITGFSFPCSKPFEYSIGKIDPRFNIDETSFLNVAKEAQNIWNNQAKRELFTYNPQADFKINLIFDERQVQSNEADGLNNELEQLKLSQSEIGKQYDSLNIKYNQAIERYNDDVSKYEKQLKQYEKNVEKWNEGDKTSQSEYDGLQEEKKELSEFYAKLQKKQSEINILAGRANNLVSQENKVVSDYNSSISTYKEKYGTVQEFEKGINSGMEINIYQFKQIADLRMTLIHELGHSLGMGHVENEKSIMYYLMGEQDMENPTFSDEDMAELNKVCKIK